MTDGADGVRGRGARFPSPARRALPYRTVTGYGLLRYAPCACPSRRKIAHGEDQVLMHSFSLTLLAS